MKQWVEKEFSQWVYYDDKDGKIIGSVYRVGIQNSIWGAKTYTETDNILGQYIDSDYARKAVEKQWRIYHKMIREKRLELKNE